jgi:hypothetical protein
MSDAIMMQKMVRENLNKRNTDTLVIVEGVQESIKAYAEGKVDFEAVSDKSTPATIRLAPSFIVANVKYADLTDVQKSVAYTTVTLAKFLGMHKGKQEKPKDNLVGVLNALDLSERALLPKSTWFASKVGTEGLYDATRLALNNLQDGVEELDVKSRLEEFFQRVVDEGIDKVGMRNLSEEIFDLPKGSLSGLVKRGKRKAKKQRAPSEEEITLEELKAFIENAKKAQSSPALSAKLSVPPEVLETAYDVIESGLRSLAKVYHPDVKGGSHCKMTQLNAAVSWLRGVVKEKENL